jgi:hypothetical protein
MTIQPLTIDFRGKLPTTIWETDFIKREHTEELIEQCGAAGIAVFIAVVGWCCHESNDLCFYAKSINFIARRLKLDPQNVQDVLGCLASKSVDLLQYDPATERWFSRRLFAEGMKLLRKQSNARGATELERFFTELCGHQRRVADESGVELELEKDQEKDLEQEKETATSAYAHLQPQEAEKFIKADLMLASPETPRVQSSNLFIVAGRRPMLKYPNIWLSPAELVQVIDGFHDKGLDGKTQKKVFESVSSRVTSQVAAGKGIEKIHVYGWLTGFELTNTLQQVKASKDLERSETYLTNARVI